MRRRVLGSYGCALIVGLPLGAAGYWLAYHGWGYALVLAWPLIAVAALVIAVRSVAGGALPTAHRVAAVVVAGAVALGLAGVGVGELLIEKRSLCDRADRVIAAIERYRQIHGAYPNDAEAVANPDHLRLRFNESTSSGGYDCAGMNDSDLVIYASRAPLVAMIPVTKRLPFSFTRFYVLARTADVPTWSYDKIIWDIEVR